MPFLTPSSAFAAALALVCLIAPVRPFFQFSFVNRFATYTCSPYDFGVESRPIKSERIILSRLTLTASSSVGLSPVLEKAPFNDIIPFLSEHIQPSDQLLFVGASTDMALHLVAAGFGVKKTGFTVVVDSNADLIKECERRALADTNLAQIVSDGKLKFVVADLMNMPEVCKQSSFDAIVDYGGLDALLIGPHGKEGTKTVYWPAPERSETWEHSSEFIET